MLCTGCKTGVNGTYKPVLILIFLLVEVELAGVVVDDGVVDGAGAARGRGACRWRVNAAYSIVILV
jgi:hypothetical protein